MNNVYIVLEYDLTTERDREHVDVVKELGVKRRHRLHPTE